MTIIAAPDSFKNNFNSYEACEIIKEGILRADSNAIVHTIPLADGGEGTADAITYAAKGRFIKVHVTGPMGGKIGAKFGLIKDRRVAVLDMASASGIELLGKDKLNPMKATSYGTGELIAAALDTNAEEIIVGIGGSATNDGGLGMLCALGFRALDVHGRETGYGGEALARITSFDASGADKRLCSVSIRAACDVTNPLLGPDGASLVFGPQKGASTKMAKQLEAGMARLGEAWIKAGLATNLEQPGDGAGGGIGAALRVCLKAKIESGALLVMRYAGFFDRLAEADLIITGEGTTDSQTACGKLCTAVAREGRKAGVPVALLSGALCGNTADILSTFDYAVSIACGQSCLDEMIKDSRRDLSFAAENLIRAVYIGRHPYMPSPC